LQLNTFHGGGGGGGQGSTKNFFLKFLFIFILFAKIIPLKGIFHLCEPHRP
jgi:hypothetical protein